MPDKPLWLDRIPQAVEALGSLPDPWVDRSVLESVLGIGRRRAQQLLAPVASRRLGTSLLARREDLVAHLRRIADGEAAYYEQRRQQRLWRQIAHTREQWTQQPPLLVEIGLADRRRIEILGFKGLPEGVELGPGSILVRFSEPDEALQKLMALAIAISQNRQAFDWLVVKSKGEQSGSAGQESPRECP